MFMLLLAGLVTFHDAHLSLASTRLASRSTSSGRRGCGGGIVRPT
jgi:hypothetical protein